MKAEHRKELQTNALADRLGKMVESVKSGPKISLWIWVVLVLAVGLYLFWSFTSKSSANQRSLLWLRLDGIADEKSLQEFADANTGTPPARTARYELARLQLQDGVEQFGSPDKHAEAVKKLVSARTIYLELAQGKGNPILVQEAMMGTAKAEETLIGDQGTVDQAIENYEKLAQAYPESLPGLAAAKRAQYLKDNRKQVEAFYAELNQRMGTKVPTPSSTPPSGPTPPPSK